MTAYTTLIENEALDAICLAELGDVQHLPATLALNPGLAAVGLILPVGTTVQLPDAPAPVSEGSIRLWGKT